MALTSLVFLAAYFGCLAASLSGRVMFGVYAYLLAFYAHPPSRWWGASLPDLRWSLLAALVMLVSVMSAKDLPKGNDLFRSVPGRLLIIFCVWLWLQNAWALAPERQIFVAVLFTKYTLLVWLLYRILHSEENIRKFLIANVAGGAYLAYLAYTAPAGGRLDGVGGPGLDEANALGMHLGVIAVFLAMVLMTERSKWWWVALAAGPLVANALVQTGSRGSFLAVICGGMALWYLRPPGRSVLFYTFAGVAVAGFLAVAGVNYWERMSTLQAVGSDEEELERSAASRIVIAEAQLRMAKSYPQGAGYSGTGRLSPYYMPSHVLTAHGSESGVAMRASHNTLLTVLVETGWFGFLLALIAIAWTALSLKRLKRMDIEGGSFELGWYRAATGAALVVVFTAGLFRDYMTAESQIWCLVLLLSMLRIQRSRTATAPAASRTRKRRIIGAASHSQAEGAAGGGAASSVPRA